MRMFGQSTTQNFTRFLGSEVTGRHERPVDSDVAVGVTTTRSNRLKFRLPTMVGFLEIAKMQKQESSH